jgi:hypothetical protein
MKGILSNQILLDQGNNIVLHWSLWPTVYDFDIEYKLGKDNCITNLLTREAHPSKHQTKETKMFARSIGSSSMPSHLAP